MNILFYKIKKRKHEKKKGKQGENENNSLIGTISTSTVILCTHSVPLHISIPEFLAFVAPVEPYVSHYRIIRYFVEKRRIIALYEDDLYVNMEGIVM